MNLDTRYLAFYYNMLIPACIPHIVLQYVRYDIKSLKATLRIDLKDYQRRLIDIIFPTEDMEDEEEYERCITPYKFVFEGSDPELALDFLDCPSPHRLSRKTRQISPQTSCIR